MRAGLLAVGNFTAIGVRQAVYMLISLTIGMSIREFARAWTATRLHDPTPRLWGRLTLNPKAWFEPFGSGLVPALLAVLWAVGVYVIPAAYAKPAPVDPSYFRKTTRDTVLVSLAGPVATLVLGILAGLVVRGGASSPAEVFRFALVLTYTSMALVVFHLLPIPGLDGARLVGLALPPDAARVYRDADKYLPLFVLLAMFVLAGVINGIVYALVDVLCQAASGVTCAPPH